MIGLTTSYYLNSPLENRKKNTKWKQQLYENVYSNMCMTQVKPCCAEGLMEHRCTSNKHSSW